jgi:cob(I)alamin adenosyltransferase
MPVHLSKIYTRGGDQGETSLIGGERISKADLRLDTYGTADELNSVLGLLRTCAEQDDVPPAVAAESAVVLARIQNSLFDVGSVLATPAGETREGMPCVAAADIAFLEDRIDAYNVELPALDSFVLPGGTMLNAYAHLGRTVCRRFERLLARLDQEAPVTPTVLRYVNRLSDYLFVYARWVAQAQGADEYLWQHPLRDA